MVYVETEAGIVPVVIIYDTGSEVSRCNNESASLIVDTKKANKKVMISTVNSVQAKLRKVHRLKVGEDWSPEAIMIPNMKLRLQALDVPEVWKVFWQTRTPMMCLPRYC